MRISLKWFQIIFIAMIATLIVACASTDKQGNLREDANDAALTAKIKTKLLDNKSANGLAIKVETYQGIVRLSGFVKTAAERQRAVNVARSIKGVVAVKNDVQIQ